MSDLTMPEELRGLLGEMTVLDVRWRLGRDDGREQYVAGHVPGAAYVDLETDLADVPTDPVDSRGRHPLPDPGRFAAAMRRSGVSGDRPVVVYDDWAGRAATRAWWLLRYHGHRDVRVLDGGWSGWQACGGEVETGVGSAAPGDFTAVPGGLALVDADGARRLATQGVLVDNRAPERFRGEQEPVDPVAGHVPGAVNVPTDDHLRGGRFRPLAELAEVYRVTEGAADLGVYCGSGVSATHAVFVLHLLGRQAALYAGSWSGWVSDPTRPVDTRRGDRLENLTHQKP